MLSEISATVREGRRYFHGPARAAGQVYNVFVICSLCGQRKARRSCPALSQQICPVCCGTKRLVEIHCPSDCVYLVSAHEHPAATLVRQQRQDVGLLVHFIRDLNRRQTDLFTDISTFVQRYEPHDLQPIIDDDVTEAASSLAATYETASRGVIYEHRPASLPAGRLADALRPLIEQAAKGGGSAFERDAAVTLRRVEEAAREARGADPSNRRAFLDLLNRVLKTPAGRDAEAPEAQHASRLIVP